MAGSGEGSGGTRSSRLQGFLSSLFASIGGVIGTFYEVDQLATPGMDMRAAAVHQHARGDFKNS